MHRWGASVFIILMFLHMGRVFLFGAYKYPRELNWMIGVLLLTLGHARGLHRLPAPVGPDRVLGDDGRDQHQRHGAVRRPVPRAVPPGRRRDRAATRSRRFYSIHMLVAARRDHRPDRAAPVPRDPPRRHLAAVVEGGRRRARTPPTSRRRASGLVAARRREGGASASERRIDERRARSSSATRRTSRSAGSRSTRYAMFHDTVMSLVVVRRDHRARVIWKFTVPGDHTSTAPGWLGPLYTSRPTRGRSASSRGRTGTSTSSSTCCGSSSGRSR